MKHGTWRRQLSGRCRKSPTLRSYLVTEEIRARLVTSKESSLRRILWIYGIRLSSMRIYERANSSHSTFGKHEGIINESFGSMFGNERGIQKKNKHIPYLLENYHKEYSLDMIVLFFTPLAHLDLRNWVELTQFTIYSRLMHLDNKQVTWVKFAGKQNEGQQSSRVPNNKK